jgi:hypothetical protein
MVLLRKNFVKGFDYYSRAIFGQVWPELPRIAASPVIQSRNGTETGAFTPF